MNLLSRLVKMFSSRNEELPPEVKSEVETSLQTLNATIMRAEETNERVIRRADRDTRRSRSMVETANEAARLGG